MQAMADDRNLWLMAFKNCDGPQAMPNAKRNKRRLSVAATLLRTRGAQTHLQLVQR